MRIWPECRVRSTVYYIATVFCKTSFVRDAAKREAKARPPLPSNAGEKALALHQGLGSMEALQAFLLPATLLESGSGTEL